MSNRKFSIRHDAARKLAQRGIPVFCCRVNSKEPATLHGYTDATTDLEIIDRWWSVADYNYGYRPWDMHAVVFDLDLYKRPADDTLLAEIPEATYTVLTPSGGEHRYFRVGHPWPNQKLAPWVDVRCGNGYVLGPGSVINNCAYIVKR